jgi:UDP-N-acetylglucosamine transferase subunit ALG13
VGAVSILFVTLGTDHHPFVRLVAWIEHWARENPDWQVHIQHGATPPPRGCTAFAFCDHDRLQELFTISDAVVSHGGPATITEARRHGHLPVVVPRDPRLGEHVDNHQMLFCGRLNEAGLIRLVENEDGFADAVKLSTTSPGERERHREDPPVPPGVFAVGKVVEELVAGRRRPR